MEGQIINKRFLVLRSLGEGAAGEVFEVSLLRRTKYGSSGDRFAIKVYKPWVRKQKQQAYRIDRELRAGLAVDSPNIVKTFELDTYKGQSYLVMEYLRGKTLRDWIKEQGRLSFNDLMEVTGGIISGIHTLHSHKLIHRDIKPDNIMMTDRGPVIMDLGVIQDISSETVITGDQFLGTIAYAAPEYLFGEEYGPNIDVYSFGLILYELIFGNPPYPNDLYWTRLILEKHEEVEHGLLPILYSKNGMAQLNYPFKESLFLITILQGCLACKESQYDLESSRFRSEQVYRAISTRVWKHFFCYPIISLFDEDFELWPSVPLELEMKVNKYVSSELKELPLEATNIIWESTSNFLGSVKLVENKDGLRKRKNLFKDLEKRGLVWLHYINKGPEKQLESAILTPLAWQLLLRGIIRPRSN